ncbi:MAG: hypothetical protein QG574_1789 [Cyanobacteriota bacterium erpe_2018_sw_21hr_WHONDRS-SW48-000092_B_bin.40]|nr:hypothetical protein [Cyanobacteriota bacterium erpe_2018_sw_21hr_WHONDRS-SW48-000092_B_bin.40]
MGQARIRYANGLKTMVKYAVAFFVAMILSSSFVNYKFPPSRMPAGVADVISSSLGVWKRREGLIPEVKIVDSYRKLRYIGDVNNKNENRDADAPGMGNN